MLKNQELNILDGKLIIDSDDIDVLDALCLEGLIMLNVRRDLLATPSGECTGNAKLPPIISCPRRRCRV